MMSKKHEFTSKQVAVYAAIGVKSPESLSLQAIRAVCASALTQIEDRNVEVDIERLFGVGPAPTTRRSGRK